MKLAYTLRASTALVFFGLSACATLGEADPEPTPDQVAEMQRLAKVDATANMDVANVRYTGPMPPILARADGNTDALGNIGIGTEEMIRRTEDEARRLGMERGLPPSQIVTMVADARANMEGNLRGLVVKDVKLCARVVIQKKRLGELRQQIADVEMRQGKLTRQRKWLLGLSAASNIAGGALAFGNYGPLYGWPYVLSSTVPGLANTYIWSKLLDNNDLQVGLSLAMSRYFADQNEFWLDSMDAWCPSFMEFVDKYGTIAENGVPAGTYPQPGFPSTQPILPRQLPAPGGAPANNNGGYAYPQRMSMG